MTLSMKFSLRSVAYVIALVAATTTFFGLPGLFLAGTLSVFWFLMIRWAGSQTRRAAQHNRGAAKRNRWLLTYLFLLGCCVVFVCALLVRQKTARLDGNYLCRKAWVRNKCSEHVRAIPSAMWRFLKDHGHYPPPYLVDENGRPAHSWRVLLLPYLGNDCQALYQQYRFDEPWNGPHNIELLQAIPPVYQCPGLGLVGDPPSTDTCYVAIVGPASFWRVDGKITREDVLDNNLQSTLVALELHGEGIPWTCPKDISVERAVQVLTSGEHNGHVSRRERLFHVARIQHQARSVACLGGWSEWASAPLSNEQLAFELVSTEHHERHELDKMRRDAERRREVTRETICGFRWKNIWIASLLTFIALFPLIYVRSVGSRPGRGTARRTQAAADSQGMVSKSCVHRCFLVRRRQPPRRTRPLETPCHRL